jgi:hypothetical protein
MTAESRLCAQVMAWKSPVKCRLIACAGRTRAFATAGGAALAAKHRSHRRLTQRQRHILRPIFFNPCARPMETVVLPSPAGVGVMAETRMSFPAVAGHAGLEAHLGHVPSMKNEVFGRNAESFGDGGDVRMHGRWKCARWQGVL